MTEPIGKRKSETGNRSLRPLNRPAPVAVEADAHGLPQAVLWKGVFTPVAGIADSWRIDDEWWREEIARRYFVVELQGGRRITLYHDLVADLWYAQTYEAPQAEQSLRKKRA